VFKLGIFLLMFLVAGCALIQHKKTTDAGHFEDTWIPLDQWAKSHGLPPPERIELPPVVMAVTNGFRWNELNLKARTSLIALPTFSLRASNGVLTVQPQTRTAYWDDVQIHLGFAPKLVQGEPLLNALDAQKTIEPLLRLPSRPASNRVIVLDPADRDAAGAQPDYTLDWAQRLSPLLASNGWQVVITRTNSVNRSPVDRAALADMYHPELFLNLDFNSDPANPGLAGVETFCVTPADMPSNVLLARSENIWRVYPNNAFDALNWQYGFRIHQALAHVPGAEDHGLRRSRASSLLCERAYPAVRISGGYLSNAHDAALITSPVFRQKLAEAIAAALP
jgi:N-acetylmuramoyl-L-alanine amidase